MEGSAVARRIRDRARARQTAQASPSGSGLTDPHRDDSTCAPGPDPLELGRLLLVLVGLGAMLGVWILSCPPNSAPDEASQLTRGISAAGGQLIGVDAAADYKGRGALQVTARRFDVPAHLAVADNKPCYATKPNVPASCGPSMLATHQTTAVSHVGGYFPLPYLPLGVAERAATTPDEAVFNGRLVSAALCLVLLLLAFTCLRSRWQRAAWLSVLTPITLWTAATAATNGLEISGAVCVLAATTALAENRVVVGSTAWVSGATALGCAKAAGPAWLAAVLILAYLANGARGVFPRLVGRWRLVLTIPALAIVGNLAWSALYLTNNVKVARRPVEVSAHAAWHETVTSAVPQMFTAFGWEDTDIPPHLWLVGASGLALVLLISAVVVSWRVRATILLAALTFFVGTVLFTFDETRVGFGAQSRYTAALFVAIPLVAVLGSAARRRAPAAPIVAVVLLLWAGAAALAAFYNLHRYAVGARAPLSLAHVQWSPPGGVDLTLALLVVGLIALPAAVALSPQRPRHVCGF